MPMVAEITVMAEVDADDPAWLLEAAKRRFCAPEPLGANPITGVAPGRAMLVEKLPVNVPPAGGVQVNEALPLLSVIWLFQEKPLSPDWLAIFTRGTPLPLAAVM